MTETRSVTEAIRVLLIDDSVVIRRILSDVLGSHPDIEIVGTASNGSIGLQRIAQYKPDLVVMDIEMPVMDGIETLRELRKIDRDTPVIMFSTLTGRGAKATMEALSLGASDYVTKPANVGSVNASMEEVRSQLVPRILALSGKAQRCVAPRTAPPASVLATRRVSRAIATRSKAVVIAVSTGGPKALQTLIPALPADIRVPILIVQHMPPLFTAQLAQRLDSLSPLKVVEGAAGLPVESGMVVIAPGDYHMIPKRVGDEVQIALHQGPQQNSCRPAADELFREAVNVWGACTLGVVMTGMGHDGAAGARLIHEAGGRVIAQDEATSVVWGMPGAVFDDGTAEQFFALFDLADAIASRVALHSPPGGANTQRFEAVTAASSTRRVV